MTNVPIDFSAVPEARQRDSYLRAVLTNPMGLLAAIILTIVLLIALFAPLLAPHDPTYVAIFKVNAAPGDGYMLGGDGSGRDILSRLLHGARNTLIGVGISTSVALLIGVTMGLFAGYYGGALEQVSTWISDGLMSLPALIVLLALYKTLGSSIHYSMAIFGVLLSPGFYRLTRNLVHAVKNELYIDAARVSGLSDLRIIRRHILLAVRAPIIIQLSIVAGISIVMQAGLEFLGLGDSSLPTWGGMLQDAFANLYVSPRAVYWPGLSIAFTVAALVLLANVLRDRMQQGGVRRHRAAALPTAAPSQSTTEIGKEDLLVVDDLVVGYPGDESWKAVVKGVSLSLKRGEILGLVGESGSGKTQTAFSILRLLPKGGRILGGSIVFDGQDLANLNDQQMARLRGKGIAYVPQEPMSNLDPCFKIGFQLMEPMRAVLGLSRAEARSRAFDLLKRVGLPNPQRVFDSYPHQISGGMAQRVLIAGAISCNPDLLIADEPTTALDVTVQAEILDLLRDIQRDTGMAILIVTHNFGVVADLCDRVAVMQNGQIVESNDVRSLFAEPQHDYTRSLLDAILDDTTTRSYLAPKTGEVRP
ncbi:dipeptide/oligopeptide/nickel ABC transporter permease/ATP-binding protein [Shinella sp. DD12]|uniref:dipeptide/oligopeptide/nickel ABC transporter permease/ATP-binding protein n=1 Tax=Shinella sp. DD12 TaxID=1410620 RepID=UPI0003C557CA|nr:dipeptide/oligopeptide/nickel ABC transporter permease/ATP-binding protein [Shinella sp. DD12]EYR83774.1 putative peptide ABC transporter ATP-binding protein y4tR [Shinella sp. DD12]